MYDIILILNFDLYCVSLFVRSQQVLIKNLLRVCELLLLLFQAVGSPCYASVTTKEMSKSVLLNPEPDGERSGERENVSGS